MACAPVDWAKAQAEAKRRGELAASTTLNRTSFWESFDSILKECETLNPLPARRPCTVVRNGIEEGNLRSFLVEYYTRQRNGSNDSNDSDSIVNDYLSINCPKKPTAAFWKTFAHYLSYRVKPVDGITHLSRSTFSARIFVSIAAYERLTKHRLDDETRQVCRALAETVALDTAPPVRVKQICTFANYVRLIKLGVFNAAVAKSARLSLPRCSRERLQLAAFLALLMFTGARPGELVVSPVYKHNGTDALKWKDVQFFISAQWPTATATSTATSTGALGAGAGAGVGTATATGAGTRAGMATAETLPPTLTLRCDVTIRNLKGMRNNPKEFRAVPLYVSDEVPRGCDATVLLAALADFDDVHGNGIKLAEAVSNCDVNYFHPDNCTYIEVPLDPRFAETFVFRQFDQDDDKLLFVTDPNMPMDYDAMTHRAKQAARDAGLIGFTCYSMRRCTANSLQTPDVTEADVRNLIGHRTSSKTFAGEYQSKLATIDAQGLVVNGKQERDNIAGRGLRQVDSSITLTASETFACHDDPRVKEAMVTLEALDEQVSLATAQLGKASAELLKQRDAARYHKTWVLSVARSRRLEEKRRTARQERDIAALHNRSPSSARDHLPDKSGPEASMADDEDEDEEDGETDIDEDEAAALAAAEIMFRMEQGQVSAAETINETSTPPAFQEQDDATSEETNAMTAPVSVEASSSRDDMPPQDKGRRLATALETLYSDVNPWLEIAWDPSPLFVVSKLDLPSTFALLTSEVGTVNYRRFRTQCDHGCRCPTCDRKLGDRALGGTPVEHMRRCAEKGMLESYQRATSGVWMAQICYMGPCRKTHTTMGDAADDVLKHMYKHPGHERTMNCDKLLDDGTECTFAVSKRSDKNRMTMAVHCERVHGIPVMQESSVHYCIAHNRWLFGVVQREAHFQEHLVQWLHDNANNTDGNGCEQDTETWATSPCDWCARDATLPASARMALFPVRSRLAGHILLHHIYKHTDPAVTCPMCKHQCDMLDYIDHLATQHGMHLTTARTLQVIGRDFSKLSTAYASKTIRDAWVEKMTTSTPSTSALDATASSSSSSKPLADKPANGTGNAATKSPQKRKQKHKSIDEAPSKRSPQKRCQQNDENIDPRLLDQ